MRSTPLFALNRLAHHPALSFAANGNVSYQQDIKPIFDSKCLACHGCYDAPCQLKLETMEGLDRGASKQPVYNGGRTENADPTRLFIDAQSTAEWRDKGFYSVVDSAWGMKGSLLYKMLELGKQHEFSANHKLPDDISSALPVKTPARTRTSLTTTQTTARWKACHSVTGLTDDEFSTLKEWMHQGAPMEPQT